MALATTYGDGSTLNREDLRDLLTVVEPEKTPVTSMLPKEPAAQSLYSEWGMDALNTPEYNAVEEGADVDNHDNPAKNRVRTGNYQEKLRRTWAVSREQEKVSTAGITDEVANAKSRSVKEIKRDIETLICGDQEMSTSNPTNLRAIGKWIQNGAQATNPVDANYRTPTGSINTTATASLTDGTIGGVLQSYYEQTGEAAYSTTAVAGPAWKRAVTNLQRATGTTTSSLTYHVNQNATEHAIDLRVDEYHTDFGSLFIVPTVFNGRSSGAALTDVARARTYLVDPENYSLIELMSLEGYDQDDNGAGPRGYVEWMGTLCVKSPLKGAKFAATS